MSNDIQFMIEYICREVTLKLMSDFGWDIKAALSALYDSDTYAKLENPATGMFYQSPVYVYDILSEELRLGKIPTLT